MKSSLDYIKERNIDSRTIIFNASMASLTAFLLSISTIIQTSYPITEQLLAPTLVFISSIGNIILYGMTKVKDNI